jgi:hypothetical protein
MGGYTPVAQGEGDAFQKSLHVPPLHPFKSVRYMFRDDPITFPAIFTFAEIAVAPLFAIPTTLVPGLSRNQKKGMGCLQVLDQ